MFATLEVEQDSRKRPARVVVAPSRFLEATDRASMETAFEMVFTTFGFGEPDAPAEFVPVIFSDAPPARFLAFLVKEKGIPVGEAPLCVTPGGV